jgi:drug/metabolite transporter (DMT)-like permease
VLPHVLLFVAVVVWGWTFVATKIVVAEIGPVEVFTLRLAIGLPFLGCILLAKRVPLAFTRDDAKPLIVGGGIFTLHFLVQITGLETTTATNTAWIITVTPLVLAVLSVLFLGERIGWNAIAGIAVATAGILLLVSRGRLADLSWLRSTGDWLALASAHTWAFYTVSTRDLVRRRHPLAVTFAILATALVLTAPLFAAVGDAGAIRSLSPRGVAAILYLAIPGMALGHWFWQEGVAALGGARSGLYLYLEPLATVTLAVPLLGEPFGPFIALGGAMVLAGVWIGQRERPIPAPAPAVTTGTYTRASPPPDDPA